MSLKCEPRQEATKNKVAEVPAGANINISPPVNESCFQSACRMFQTDPAFQQQIPPKPCGPFMGRPMGYHMGPCFPYNLEWADVHRLQRIYHAEEEAKSKIMREIDEKRSHKENIPAAEPEIPTSKKNICPFLGFGRIESREYSTYHMLLIEMPGMTKDDIVMEIEDNLLIVSCDRPEVEKGEEYVTVYSERITGHFERKFEILSDIDQDKISGNYVNGVLRIQLPKKKMVKSERKKISLN